MTSVYIPRNVRADAAQALVLLNAGLQNATAGMRLWLRRMG